MENQSYYDPLVFGETTLLDILACERGVRGESLDIAVSFHKRLMSKDASKARHELYVLQAKLWDVEQKLNTPINERIVLEQGWLNGPEYELAHLYVRMTERLELQTATFKEMTDKHGNADGLRAIVESMMPDVRKDVQAYVTDGGRLDPEDLFPGFPRGFRYMNACEVDDLISALRELRQKYKGKLVERKKAQEIEMALKRVQAAEFRRKDDLRVSRKAEIDREHTSYKDVMKKLSEHQVFRLVSLPSLNLALGIHDEHRLGSMNEEAYKLLLNQLRGKMKTAQRGLREPLRRAWQSAQSRGVTRLGFQEYLDQEGFGSLLTA